MTLITIVGVIVGLLYINRGQLINDFKMYQIDQRDKEWEKDEPTGQLIDGKRNGKWTTTYKNGQLESTETYLNDTLHGPQLIYYPNGQLYIKRNYSKGKEIDSTIWYHSSGQVYEEGFRDSLGLRQGLFKIYHSNGQLSQIAYFKNGKFDGEDRSFFNNGQLREIKNYKLGQRVGKWIEFSKNADTVKVENY